MVKLIAIDIDGTLLGKNRKVPKANIKALKAAREAGIKIAIATGRNPVTIKKISKLIGCFDAEELSIGLNGGMVFKYENQKPVVLKEHLFKEEDIKFVYDYASDKKITLFSYPQDYKKAIVNTKSGIFVNFMKIHAKRKLTLFKKMKEVPLLYKIIAYGKGNQMLEFREEMNKKGYSTFAFSYFSNANLNIEMNPSGVDKATALKEIAEMYNIKSDEVMYFGDGENDLKSLEWAGQSVAMGQAKEHIKKVAKFVTVSNKKNGVAKFINEHVLSKK